MPSPTILFLDQGLDGKFHVNDADGFAFGMGYEIPDAIKHAHSITNAPVDIGCSHAGFERLCVSEKPRDAEPDAEVFISMLAELAGMKVTKLFDDNVNFIGYQMRLKE